MSLTCFGITEMFGQKLEKQKFGKVRSRNY